MTNGKLRLKPARNVHFIYFSYFNKFLNTGIRIKNNNSNNKKDRLV